MEIDYIRNDVRKWFKKRPEKEQEQILTALDASIKHWHKNEMADFPSSWLIGIAECALCVIFWNFGCVGCPIRAATGIGSCRSTPYSRVNRALDDWKAVYEHPSNDSSDDSWNYLLMQTKFRNAAREETKFLRNLKERLTTEAAE